MRTVKRIGRGAFTTAYLMENGRVLLRSVDPIKEAMALEYFPKSQYFPVVDYVEQGVYEMDFYPRIRGLKAALASRDYAIYQSLRALFTDNALKCKDYYDWWNVFEEANDTYGIPYDVVQAVLDAMAAIVDFYDGSVNFEISPRNVAVSADGGLILLDCFYLQSELDKVRGRS